ncbi:MOSC domain-containing protein [Variovorax sp. GT1P44]|uniref:MOSC domain-containing protein n=1 Tax=Variovorax sp. GT1P44 TaxID=3443742 RepID=UPI003F464CE4
MLDTTMRTPYVLAVSRSRSHTFSKEGTSSIRLLEGLGAEGDAHSGETVKHRSRVARNPLQPNLRQVHLVQAELFDELASLGFNISPGEIGENIATKGLDLLALPAGTELEIGSTAVVRLTGLRNPCKQLDAFRKGLKQAVLGSAADGALVRKAGVMGIVLVTGEVAPEDSIAVRLPGGPHRALQSV